MEWGSSVNATRFHFGVFFFFFFFFWISFYWGHDTAAYESLFFCFSCPTGARRFAKNGRWGGLAWDGHFGVSGPGQAPGQTIETGEATHSHTHTTQRAGTKPPDFSVQTDKRRF